MNPSPALTPDYMSWSGLWITLLAIAVATGVVLLARVARDSWRRTGRRLDHDLPRLLDDPIRTLTSCDLGNHPGPYRTYANYGIWLCCGTREEQPYDQQMDRTDLGEWDQEMTSKRLRVRIARALIALAQDMGSPVTITVTIEPGDLLNPKETS